MEALFRDTYDRQVEALIAEHGASSFSAVGGSLPDYTLFVEGESVIAVAAGEPRHPYGAFCELPRELALPAVETVVRNWLQSGEAYNTYLSMNVCRNNC